MIDIDEYLADFCANTKCTDKNGSECDKCMYEKGRADVFEALADLMKSLDARICYKVESSKPYTEMVAQDSDWLISKLKGWDADE